MVYSSYIPVYSVLKIIFLFTFLLFFINIYFVLGKAYYIKNEDA